MRTEFRPIDRWDGPFTERRVRSPFSSTYTATSRLLEREATMLNAEVVLLCLALGDSQILRDRSGPYARAIPDHPGVQVVLHDTKHGTLRYATDRFLRWHDNLRAIALGLEALRRVDRYGITRSGEQYRGFAALPAPTGDGASHLTATDAVALLADLSDLPFDLTDQPAHRRSVIRRARAAAHPDRNGGDHSLWDRVEQAVALVDR